MPVKLKTPAMGKKKPLRNSHGRGEADIAIGRGEVECIRVP